MLGLPSAAVGGREDFFVADTAATKYFINCAIRRLLKPVHKSHEKIRLIYWYGPLLIAISPSLRVRASSVGRVQQEMEAKTLDFVEFKGESVRENYQ